MFKINHNIDYYSSSYITPSYIINKKNYLPKLIYNLKKNNRTQLFLIYRELLRTLTAIKKYLIRGNTLIDTDLENQLALFRADYPITQEKYATYCSTVLNLIYKDGVNFSDIAIQQTYDNLKNKVIFTSFAQNIINEIAEFINSKLERFNYLVEKINIATDSNYDDLPTTINPITENYLDIVETNIIIYTNANNNL